MDEAEQNQHEAHLRELFDSFDASGTGTLGQAELTDLCRVLHLEEVAPGALQQALLQENRLGRVHFDQFKEALILILSTTLTNEDSFQEPDSSPEAQPKYIKGGKRYGRRSLPEFQKSAEEFAEVTVIECLDEEARPARISGKDCDGCWRSQDSEEYEAEGQLRFWNPDDLNASPHISPTQDWIEEKLQEVCQTLGISRDGHLNRKKLISVCEQFGLQNIDAQVLHDVFHGLEHDGTVSIEDFFYGLFKIGKPLPPSASTPYRQFKRHLSMQSFDESGRRNMAPSAMAGTISFRVFSSLDDGTGYVTVEHILDLWHEEGIENSHEIMKALDFNLDGKISLTELTFALENELLATKNGIHQAALASFKTEIQHLMERVDQVVREKEKLRLDLEKAEKWKSLMASEVDDHHAAIEHRNEYNLRKLEEEYKERVTVLKNELRKEREQILQLASKQRAELEQEIKKLRTEENYLRDRLALTLKENSRLESELLETGENLVKYENMANKLQKNLENVLAEKFGDLDPSSAEFFLQKERLAHMKAAYERQCRELQDQIDELQSQLQEFRAQGRVVQPSFKNSLFEELDDGGVECNQELGSEDCNVLNMSIEAEMALEQMKEEHHRALCDLQQQLETTMCHYEKQLEETKSFWEKERESTQQKYSQETQATERQMECLRAQVADLQGELARLGQRPDSEHCADQTSQLISLEEEGEEQLRARVEEANESFNREREELIQARVWMEEKMRALAHSVHKEKAELERGFHEQLQLLMEKHALAKEQLLEKHRQEREEERAKMESEFNGRLSRTEEQFSVDRQALASKYGEAIKGLEESYRRELQEFSDLQREEKSQWEFEKDEIIQEGADAQEKWKEMLEKEKAVSSVLAQEKELLEQDFKERMNALVLEKEQLRKELQDTRKLEDELRKRLFQIQAGHERELKEREERIAVTEGNWKLVLQKLETDFGHQKEQLSSRLVALERLKRQALDEAEEEKTELRKKVSELQSNVETLKQELFHRSKAKSGSVSLNEETQADGDDGCAPEPGTVWERKEMNGVLSTQRKIQVPEGGGGGGSLVPVMRRVLTEPGRESNHFPSFAQLVPDALTDLLMATGRDKTEDGTEEDMSAYPMAEIEATGFEENTEASSNLGKTYEEIWAENETLRLQKCQLQKRIRALEAECTQAAHERQAMACQMQNELQEILQTIPKPKTLSYGNVDGEGRERPDIAATHPNFATGNKKDLTKALEVEGMGDRWPPQFGGDHSEAAPIQNGELKNPALELWRELQALPLPEELMTESQALKAETIKVFEQNKALEGRLPSLLSLQRQLEASNQESLKLQEEKVRLLEDVRELEDLRGRLGAENAELQSSKRRLQSRIGKLEELVVSRKGRHGQSKGLAEDVQVEKEQLQELNRKLKDKIAALSKQEGSHAQERDDLNVALHGLQTAWGEQQQEVELLRYETENLREENAVLKNEIALLNEEENISNLQLRELNGSREELWQKLETVQKEKGAVQKVAENLRKQVSELKARNQQLHLENAKLCCKSSPNQADAPDLSQRFLRMLRQREKEAEKCLPEEWERESSHLEEELENCKVQASALISSLENEVFQLRGQAHALEQENHSLRQELEKTKPRPRGPGLSDLQNEIALVMVKNELLLKEKEALSDELKRCVEKVAKVAFLENLVASLKQEKASWEQHNQSLKTQVAASQEKIQNFDETVQNIHVQTSRLKSDLRVSQQEKEALKQEVMSLHKQVQTANDKNQVLELAVHSAGLQSQQKKLCWEELDQLVKQEQQLLRQENERLQHEVQSAKSDLALSREKIRQLESTILSAKQQKRQSQSGLVKTLEQEKLSLKRDCEQLQKELVAANRKISQMSSLERELESINSENEEGLRKKQVKMDEQRMELLHLSPGTMLSQSQHPRELPQLQQPGGCAVVPREQCQQLQRQLLQAERRTQRLQEELENRPSETNMPQGRHEQLLKTMEKRLMDVEQQLRLVKRLLQDKVNQLKEQFAKNTKADEMVKDLYVENAQLLKALEATEQRQKTVEKKNYLLEEKIANLGRIVKSLSSPTLGTAAQLGS